MSRKREVRSQIHSINDHFDVIDELGSGAFGTVYRCRNKADSKLYAIKAAPKKSKKGMGMDQIINEITIMASLQHPNIIRIKEPVLTSETHIYIVMEICEGGELLTKLRAEKRFSETDARIILSQVISALSCLHKRDIVHRDIKPENILLKFPDNIREVRITDFGLSETMEKNSFLEAGCGSPHYMAPEVISPEDVYDGKCDMWSVGVLMFLMLTGRRPFNASIPELYDEIAAGEFTYPSSPTLSAGAMHLIDHLIETKAQQRYTAAMALEHPWLQGSQAEMPSTLLEMMQSFQAVQRFQQLAQAVAICEVLMRAGGYTKDQERPGGALARELAPSPLSLARASPSPGDLLSTPTKLGPVKGARRKYSCPNIGSPASRPASNLSNRGAPLTAAILASSRSTPPSSARLGSPTALRRASPRRLGPLDRKASHKRAGSVSAVGRLREEGGDGLPSFMRGTVSSQARSSEGNRAQRRNSTAGPM